MDKKEMIEAISDKDFDVDQFVKLAALDENAREEIVNQMVTNKDIMVYYHCYYVVSKASKKQPELFYKYWDEIAKLLNHENSYHRNFALSIIGNLTKVDGEERFLKINGDYFELINDKKFSTGQCCLQNSIKIYKHKPELRDQIIVLLLDIDNRCNYTDKQMGLLKCDVLEIFDKIYKDIHERDEINEFIRVETTNISPKTRNKAKELVQKYGL
jgi:hypothetical protein